MWLFWFVWLVCYLKVLTGPLLLFSPDCSQSLTSFMGTYSKAGERHVCDRQKGQQQLKAQQRNRMEVHPNSCQARTRCNCLVHVEKALGHGCDNGHMGSIFLWEAANGLVKEQLKLTSPLLFIVLLGSFWHLITIDKAKQSITLRMILQIRVFWSEYSTTPHWYIILYFLSAVKLLIMLIPLPVRSRQPFSSQF